VYVCMTDTAAHACAYTASSLQFYIIGIIYYYDVIYCTDTLCRRAEISSDDYSGLTNNRGSVYNIRTTNGIIVCGGEYNNMFTAHIFRTDRRFCGLAGRARRRRRPTIISSSQSRPTVRCIYFGRLMPSSIMIF